MVLKYYFIFTYFDIFKASLLTYLYNISEIVTNYWTDSIKINYQIYTTEISKLADIIYDTYVEKIAMYSGC